MKDYRYNIPTGKKGCLKDCLFYREGRFCVVDCQNCTYCGKRSCWSGKGKNGEYDHVPPYDAQEKTVVPVCDECSGNKHGKELTEWLRLVRDSNAAKWNAILHYNKRKNNKVAEAVMKVRDGQQCMFGRNS
jgi:hypothetical protein